GVAKGRVAGPDIDTSAARRGRGASQRDSAARAGGALLHVTARALQRPCGADAAPTWLDERASADRRFRRLAEHGLPDGGESDEDADVQRGRGKPSEGRGRRGGSAMKTMVLDMPAFAFVVG